MQVLACQVLSLWLFVLPSHLYAQNKSNQYGKDNKKCETQRVINETTGSTHVITTCIHKEPIKEEAGDGNQEHFNDLGKAFRKFNDLDAQVSMAHSTYWIKVLTLAGVIIGGLGLLLLGKTLSETRTASFYARETLDFAREEYKPQLVMGPDAHGTVWGGAKEIEDSVVTIRAKIINEGKTTAQECTFSWGRVWPSGETDLPTITNFDDGQKPIGDGWLRNNRVPVPIDFPLQPGLRGQADPPVVAIRIQGFDKYGQAICVDYIIAFNIDHTDHGAINANGAVEIPNEYTPYQGVITPQDAEREAADQRKQQRENASDNPPLIAIAKKWICRKLA